MIIITGAHGRLGKEISSLYPEAYKPTHEEMDITNKRSVTEIVAKHAPSIFIHLAAWVDVRGCQSDKDRAWKTNVIGTENVVNAVKRLDSCYFIHLSTACVFSGDEGNYDENCVPCPINFYGITKLVSEFVVKGLPDYLIIRTDFVSRTPWPYPGAFVDRYSTCVFADEVARGIQKVIQEHRTGLIHLTSKQKITHYELAKLTTPNVKPIRLKDIDLNLPRDQSLSSVLGGDFLTLNISP